MTGHGPAPTVEELQTRFSGPLFLYAYRRLRDRQAAEEVVQDTLVTAWRHLDRFDTERGSMAGWLFSIARNLMIDHGRRRDARPRIAGPLRASTTVDTNSGDIDRALEAWQLAEALDGLSAEHRVAILEVHYLGATVREVAERLGVPEGTIKSRLYYGLRALRLRLQEMGVIG